MSSIVISGDTSGAITLQSPAVAGTNTVNFGANTGTAILDANTPAFRNRIINGAMVIDQRNAGASFTPSADDQYVTDRFKVQSSAIRSNTSMQQVSVPVALDGFSKALKFTANSASTVGASDFYAIGQIIEGYNWADLNWGTASAKSATFTFWVYGSITGTFGGLIKNSGQTRSYPFLYTISSANTWTQVSVTIPGDTSGTWNTTSTGSVWVELSLASGSTFTGTPLAWNSSVNVGATGQSNAYLTTSGATFYTTGWQLEKGSTATSFDYRPYGTELMLCQRYFEIISTNADSDANRYLTAAWTTSESNCYMPFKVTKRAAPTLTISANGEIYTGTWQALSSVSSIGASLIGATVNVTLTGGLIAKSVYFVRNQGITASAEL